MADTCFLVLKLTIQVCKLFQRPVEQILGFYPKGFSAKRCLKNVSKAIFIRCGTFTAAKPVSKQKLGGNEEKTQANERFKGRFTYALLFCGLGESFRGGGGGGWGVGGRTKS